MQSKSLLDINVPVRVLLIWKDIQLSLNQATCACWALYYEVTIPCKLIHLWWHLFTSIMLFGLHLILSCKFAHGLSQLEMRYF